MGNEREEQVVAAVIPVAIGAVPTILCRWSNGSSFALEFDLPITDKLYVVSHALLISVNGFHEKTVKQCHDGGIYTWKRFYTYEELQVSTACGWQTFKWKLISNGIATQEWSDRLARRLIESDFLTPRFAVGG